MHGAAQVSGRLAVESADGSERACVEGGSEGRCESGREPRNGVTFSLSNAYVGGARERA